MSRRLELRGLIIGAVTLVATAGVLALIVLLVVTTRKQAHFEGQVLRALEDEQVAADIREDAATQFDLARAQAAVPNPLLARQFDLAGRHVHEQLRFYLFRDLSATERRTVEHIRATHAQLEVRAQRVFLGAPFAFDSVLVAALQRDLDTFVASRQARRHAVQREQVALRRRLMAGALGVAIVFFGAIPLLLRLLQRRLLDRLTVLGRAAAQVGAGDLSVHVPLAYNDELTDLGAAFNRMVQDRSDATRELEASEERYRTLFDRVPIGLYRSTPGGRFLDVNPVCAGLLGYSSRDALLASEVPLPAAAREEWKQQMAAVDGRFQVTWEYVRPDGRRIWIRDTAHAIRDHAGGVIYYEGALEEVTDRVLAQAALERSEARFRSLIENGSEAILVLDHDGAVKYLSPSTQRMLGYDTGSGALRAPLELVHPDDVAVVARELANLLEGHVTSDYLEFRCRHRSGEWRVLRVLGRNLLADPHVQGVVINIQDVTEQRALEEKLLQAQKMEAVGRLAGGIAHDFNNLLTAIGGYAELLEQQPLFEGAPPQGELAEIRNAVDRAAGLTRQLLAFSRQQVVQPRALDLSGVVSNIRLMVERIIGEDVELVTTLAPDVWVLADAGQIEQVLLNFVVNSRDAMPDGGAIAIETAVTRLPAGQHGLGPGEYAELVVRDTGHGMPPDVLARAFDPFFTTKEVGRGTGLGLSTVYGIATQAGGTVMAESGPGRGAVFRVLLPLIAAPRVTQVPPPEPVPTATGCERILLVEDEPAVRGLAERVLRRQGHEVVSAPNGRAALELLDESAETFDLVVSDVVMPEVSGPEMVERMLERWPHVRVLYISGYTRESFRRSGLADTAVNFLEKPFTPEQLVRRVREILDLDSVSA